MGGIVMKLDTLVLREELSTGEMLLVYRVGARYTCVIVSGVIGDDPFYVLSDVRKADALEAAAAELRNDVLEGGESCLN